MPIVPVEPLVPPIAFAHRGARAHAPENTLDAFALALRLGATGLESDVWLTSDGVAVLDHDGIVRRKLRKVSIASIAAAELPTHIPTLGELLDTCSGPWHLSLDLKDRDAGPIVIDVVARQRPELLAKLWLCHPEWRVVAALRSNDATVKLVDSTRLARITEGPERHVATLAEHGVDALNMHHSDWSGGLVALVHRFGLRALAWDLQHDYLIKTSVRMGVDAVYSDWVDRMVDSIRR